MFRVSCIIPTLDVEQVGFAARLLDMSEFKLFAEAYQVWHGKPAPDAILESFFSRYLIDNTVPFWVRSFVRPLLNNPDLQKRVAQKRKVANCGYYVPLVLEFILIMYFLLT